MIATSNWTDEDTQKAKAAWADYQRKHDVSALHGHAVGIDPQSGRVWFGTDGLEAIDAARADGIESPLFLIRVGYSYYQRKGGRRGSLGPSRRLAFHW